MSHYAVFYSKICTKLRIESVINRHFKSTICLIVAKILNCVFKTYNF